MFTFRCTIISFSNHKIFVRKSYDWSVLCKMLFSWNFSETGSTGPTWTVGCLPSVLIRFRSLWIHQWWIFFVPIMAILSASSTQLSRINTRVATPILFRVAMFILTPHQTWFAKFLPFVSIFFELAKKYFSGLRRLSPLRLAGPYPPGLLNPPLAVLPINIYEVWFQIDMSLYGYMQNLPK